LNLSRRQALWMLAAITAAGAAFRFYNLGWGAPYYHFHIDEHFVLGPADLLRRSTRDAAMGPKFFMYSPLMMYLINIVRAGYEAVAQPLDLTVPRDQVTYMVLARSIAAAFSTATIPVAYAIAARIAGRAAGLLAAFFLACAVLHLRDAHFATTDMSLTFFCGLTILWSLRVAERGSLGSLIGAGASVGAAVACKYTGAIALGTVGIAYLLSPRRPGHLQPIGAWAAWALRGLIPIAIAVLTFFALDPLVLMFPDKFLADVQEQIFDPLLGVTRPIFFAQFADIGPPRLYWLTNLLWWSLGPMLEILGIAGVLWLLARRDPRAAVAASFPIIYFAVAGRTVAPMIRYTLPLAPVLAVSAAVLAVDWMASRRARALAAAVVGATILTTALYALAYMNVFRQPDSRVEASKWLVANVPQGSKILVEPSQNTPPMGAYFTATNFHVDYVLWGGTNRRQAENERRDYYHLYTMDTYRYLYANRVDDAEKRRYIASRLAQVDWIVIDDTYVQWYDHLPASENAVLKQHYRDLFDGKLGFALVKTFKTDPSLLGVDIRDEAAEFTFRLFDHPRVYVFRRFARKPQ
jgi:hypothetical protein